MKKINLDTYNRKDHFEFFKNFEEPFFGLNSFLQCKSAYLLCKENRISFYAFYLHAILKVVNEIPELRYRIIEDEIYDLGKINVSPTVLREDKTFGYAYVEYDQDFSNFQEQLKKSIEEVKASEGLDVKDRQNVIHFTAVPWIQFSAISHARIFKFKDSIPKIAVGKIDKDYRMPVSVHLNHALADGYHLGLFFEKLQNLLEFQ